jgi:hypothetical protein
LLTLPIVSICLAVLLTVLSRYPHIYNYPWSITAENAPRQYYLARLLLWWIMLEMVWMLCGLQGLIIQSAQSHHAPDAILLLIPASVLGLFVTIILYISPLALAEDTSVHAKRIIVRHTRVLVSMRKFLNSHGI